MADGISGVEVGTAYVTVLPSTRGFHQALANDVNQASAAAGASGGQAFAGTFGKAMPMVGAALAGAFSVRALGQFVGSAIQSASDLAESQSKVAVVFGHSAAAVNEWAKTSATSLLMSKQAALEAAGTYGNLFQAFGIGQGQATEMSTTLVKLAADLASFNNTSVDDALLALRSGLSGETEPLKRYGVAINDARMKQEALSQGIWDGVGTLDAAQKAQATYALILRDTSLAQGDVQRTGDGYANTMRAIEAAVTNAQAEIGGALLSGIQEASSALGGADGLVSLIDGLGARAASSAATVSTLASGLISIKSRIDELSGTELPPWLNALAGGDNEIAGFNSQWDWTWIPAGGGPIARAVDDLLSLREAQKSAKVAAAALTEGYVRMGPPLTAATAAQEDATTAADDAASALDRQRNAAYSLVDALDRLNKANRDRAAGVGVREDWRRLDTMGDKVWVGKGKDRRQVQLDFDPTVAGGRFGFDKTGDQARSWAASLGLDVAAKANTITSESDRLAYLRKQRRRLAGQFDEWGIDDPAAYARSFIRVPGALVASVQASRADANARDYPMGGTGGRTTTFVFNGDIKVDSDAALKQAAEEARRLARLAPHGAVAP